MIDMHYSLLQLLILLSTSLNAEPFETYVEISFLFTFRLLEPPRAPQLVATGLVPKEY